jgi:hypothetical protein
MLLIVHIIIALGSMLSSGLALTAPSSFKLRLSYALVALALASGSMLAVVAHSNIKSVCLSGLFYLGFVGTVLQKSRIKLLKTKD